MRHHDSDNLARARENLKDHACKPRISRSFDFRRDDSSHYAFSLTWTPGSISLAGDCGEVTVVHYHALRDLRGGLSWAAGSDYDYMLGKTSLRQQYSAEDTKADIIRMANEKAVDWFKAMREERPRKADYDDDEWSGVLADWADQKALYKAFDTRKRYDIRKGYNRDMVTPPDGWMLWYRLWEELAPFAFEKEGIFLASNRMHLRDELESRLDDRHDAVDLIQKLGIDDYYGAERWDFGALQRIECIRFGAKMALEIVDAEIDAAEQQKKDTPA